MKTINLFRLSMGIACLTLLFACNKNNAKTSSNNSTDTQLQTQADDQAQVSTESDAVANDANNAMYSSPAVSGNSVATSVHGGTTTNGIETNGVTSTLGVLICDATVTWDTTSTTRTITLTYNGSNCWGNRTRTGVVTITIPTGVYWRDAGATVTIDVKNLVITRVRDGKSITINGTKTFTNVSGGLLADLATIGSITHTVSGSFTVTFDNGSQRVWNEAKQRIYTYANGVVITTTGTHTDSLSNTNVAEWGMNRYGVGFESLITQAKVISQDCDFRLVSGANEILRTDNITTTITYGLDASGNPTSCPGTGTYYFKVVRTNAGGLSFTVILPY